MAFDVKGKSFDKHIKMESCDTEVVFHIHGLGNGYGSEDNDHEKYGCWVVLTLQVKSHIFNYCKKQDEMLMLGEIKNLRDYLCDLVNDRLEKEAAIGFIEPDLGFVLSPKFNWHDKNKGWCKKELEIVDISGELILNLHDKGGVYTGEKYSFPLGRGDIVLMRDYLSEVYPHLESEWARAAVKSEGE